jgi:peptide/nickel transport system substrate-binding protein
MTIERDPNYYRGWGEGPIDEVRFVITNDEATVRSMAASGELTMSSQYQSPDTYDALAKMPRFKIVKGVTPIAFYLKLNSKTAPTDDVHIRKAIALATDYDTIKSTILPGGDLAGPLPNTFAEAHLDSPQPKFDLEAAKAEIAKSGYAGKADIPLSFDYVSATKFEEEIGLLMQSNLQQIGFKVALSAEPWNRITEIASKIETTPNVTEVFFGPTYPSPDSMFYAQYHSKSAGTWASMEWAKNPEVDKMIDAARATGDVVQQNKIYKELQQKLIDDQSDAYLETQIVRHAMDKCLEGYVPVPMQSFDYAFHKYKWTCS